MELKLEIETRDRALATSWKVGVPEELSGGAELVYQGPLSVKGHLDIGQTLLFVVRAVAETIDVKDVILLAKTLYDTLRNTFKQDTKITISTTNTKVITKITENSFQQVIIQVIKKETRTKQ